MEYLQYETNKVILAHDATNVIAIINLSAGAKLHYSTDGSKQYSAFDTEAEIQAEIERIGLRPKWENDLPWMHDTAMRFKIETTNGVIDPELRALMDYAEANNVLFEQYAGYLVFYVEYILQAHWDGIFVPKGLDKEVELNNGITEIDIREQ